MRILLLGEYSGYHANLAYGLRALGHEVVVVSNGDFWKDYPRDIDVARRKGKLWGAWLWLKIWLLCLRFRGYDVVELINPMFFELKACRLFAIYRYLRRHNRRMVLCALGMDYYWVYGCVHDKPLAYSDFNLGAQLRTNADALRERADWLGTDKQRLNQMIASDCDRIIAGLYEYKVCYDLYHPKKTVFLPMPFVCGTASPAPLQQDRKPGDGKLRIFIGINKSRNEYKGTDIMLRAAEAIAADYPDKVELIKAESVPFETYSRMVDGSDVILDQLYGYTPAMNALLAMSKGIVCVGGGEEEAYTMMGESRLRPIVNVKPSYESVYASLEQLVVNPARVKRLQAESIEYVSRWHDAVKVARQWEKTV